MRVVTPIGYTEVQKSWIGVKHPGQTETLLHYAKLEMARTNPELGYFCHHVDSVPDGAGVMHHTLYVGFAPLVQSSEPLNPRNMNDAPKPDQVGDPARDNFIGMKEQKF